MCSRRRFALHRFVRGCLSDFCLPDSMTSIILRGSSFRVQSKEPSVCRRRENCYVSAGLQMIREYRRSHQSQWCMHCNPNRPSAPAPPSLPPKKQVHDVSSPRDLGRLPAERHLQVCSMWLAVARRFVRRVVVDAESIRPFLFSSRL